MHVTVDGRTVDILIRRFAAFSPQTTVHVPVGNIAEVDPQTGTLTAYGWNANVRNLRIGQHPITHRDLFDHGASYPFHHYINIVSRGHSDDDN